MKNIGQMMKQAQQMQERMQTMQEELARLEMTGSAGGGLVTVTLNGKGVLSAIRIDPSLMNADEAEVVEDLMRQVTGGLDLPPGFKLPF